MKIIVFVLCVIAIATLHTKEAHQGTFPSGKVTLQNNIGTYLGRCNNCGPASYPESAVVYETNPTLPWTIWTVSWIGDKIALRADSGKYLARCHNCWNAAKYADGVVHIENPVGNPWALWTPVDVGNGNWAFKADNGKYLARCDNCVTGSTVPNFAFVFIDDPMITDANWYMVRR